MSQEALNKCNKVIVRRSYFLVRVSNTVVSPLEGKGFCVCMCVFVCARMSLRVCVCVCVCIQYIYILHQWANSLFVLFIFYIAFKHFNIL